MGLARRSISRRDVGHAYRSLSALYSLWQCWRVPMQRLSCTFTRTCLTEAHHGTNSDASVGPIFFLLTFSNTGTVVRPVTFSTWRMVT